jgi:hypothetical protein
MKMVKSLLLGSAASLAVISMGQAADLPVKAKPVEYVKVCSLYGAGFYYMPGTDICIKIGGWARAEIGYGNVNGNFTTGPFNGVTNQRSISNVVGRARGYITADAREQTSYGTVRGYIAVGLSTNDVGLNTAANQFSANRAFVQWAGFTGGLAQSFYDFYSVPATSYWGSFPASDTGDPGWLVFGYTAQLGNGLSATISEEARRTTQIIDQQFSVASAGATGSGGTITPGSYFNTLTTNGVTAAGVGAQASGGAALFPGVGAYGGQQMGDLVGNLRVDQAWGSAQVMGVMHQVNATYYSAAQGAGPALANGHPSDAYGWAAGAGLKVLTPMFGEGDYLQTQFNATQGALRYLFFSQNGNYGAVNGSTEAYGVMTDGVYGGSPAGGNNTSVKLTSAWGFNAAYEHHWNSALHTSVYGGYDKVTYGNTANAMLCATEGFGAGAGTAAIAGLGCNNDWSVYFVGTRTQWDINKNFYLGVDVLYENLRSATTGSPVGALGAGGLALSGATALENNTSAWMFRFRAHRDFLP